MLYLQIGVGKKTSFIMKYFIFVSIKLHVIIKENYIILTTADILKT